MTGLRRSRPSPALVVAVLALVAALAGTAVAADPVATTSVSKKKTKKIAKQQARKQINKLAPGLSVLNAENATNATSAENGAAGYAEFTQTGAARDGAFNMDNLTISALDPAIYCEDQEFNTVAGTGGIGTGGVVMVTMISAQQLADLGATPATVGCPADSTWVYATFDQTFTLTPGPFTAEAF